MTTTPDTTSPATESGPVRNSTIVYVTAEGLPDAWVNGDDIEVAITQPLSATEAVIVVPIDQARTWAAELYTAVTVAYADHVGDHQLLALLDEIPHSGRWVFDRLTDDPPPQAAAS